MEMIINAAERLIKAITGSFNENVDTVKDKVDSVKSAISTQVESCMPAAKKWGPAALGAAVLTYMFPYFVGSVALATGLGLYYSRDIQIWMSSEQV